MDSAEVAWVAGVIEGEGSILLRSNNVSGLKNAGLVKVAMRDRDVIERLRSVTGVGTICVGNDQMWQWQVQRRGDVPTLLHLILPWLGERRRSQAETVLAGIAPYGWDGTNRSATRDRCVVHA